MLAQGLAASKWQRQDLIGLPGTAVKRRKRPLRRLMVRDRRVGEVLESLHDRVRQGVAQRASWGQHWMLFV